MARRVIGVGYWVNGAWVIVTRMPEVKQ